MKKINFVFVIHFHQPTGQFKWVNEKIYNNCYRLLLDIFKKYADLKFTVHISGPLLSYMREHYPEWLNEMARLGDYGTIEFLGGSIGEAILPILPSEDRFYQVRDYLRTFEKIFGYKPKGMWLPERVWEPSLPEPLVRNGLEYVFIDDSTLYRAGRSSEDTYYAWLTEESGYPMKIFFIDTGLRYVLPWRSSEEVFNYMLERGSEIGDRVIVWGSDAEKFGEWRDPEWARWWLNDFLSKIRERNEVKMVHPSEYLRDHGVRGLIYLPTGSYDKMLEWSHGFFRNFLVKYRESNNMHKKMLWVRKKLVNAPTVADDAWRYYHLAQCNDAYWHGLFGGIYLSHLRQAIYEYYIKAEKLAEEASDYFEDEKLRIIFTDFDYDGAKEYLVETPRLNAYFKPSDGGTLFELDYKEKGYEHNIQDTMTRYPEPYLEGSGFNPDWYRRVSLRMHLWAPDTTIWDWLNNTPFKDQSDLALAEYKTLVTESKELVMRTLGHHYVYGLEPAPVFVEKRIKILGNGLFVKYTLENHGKRTIETIIGYEYSIAPKIDRGNRENKIGYMVSGRFRSVEECWVGEAREIIVRSENHKDIRFTTDGLNEVWVGPINMPARTEKGFKNTFQGLGLMFVKRITLKPGEVVETAIKLEIT